MKNRFVLWIMVIFIFANAISVYSADGDGKSEALDLVESIPKDSSQAVELDTQIKLIFNKNVVNLTIKDNNSKCFSLSDSSKQIVPIDVIFADDQIEPDKKREITISPKEPLKENMTYMVEISPKLQAKNGTSLDKSISISFTTLALKPAVPAPVPSGEKAEEPESTASKPEKEIAADTPEDAQSVDTNNDVVSNPIKNSETNQSNQTISPDPVGSTESEEVTGSRTVNYVWPVLILIIVSCMLIAGIKVKKRKP